MFCISLLFFVTSAIIGSFSPARADDQQYVEDLVSKARSMKLYQERYWHTLLHYETGVLGLRSLVDDPNFFLAQDGKTNPQAELEADLRAFFQPQEESKDSVICRFVARFDWLKERLEIDPARLPVSGCRSYMEFLDRSQPKSTTLVFPMAHLNSPASMFGHTLLTVETASKSKLLSYSISYSAHANESFGPLFAIKGIFGLYPGYFSVLPYYAKLQEYRDIDRRDIWEYPLNLTEPEVRRMMLHIREMDSIAADYYFFDENCSYLLFYLLEAARPTARLTDKAHGWIIPLDSIRMIQSEGFITDSQYRPSRTTKIKYLASCISPAESVYARSLAGGEERDSPFASETPVQEKMKTYELASEYLQYLYTKDYVPEDVYQERFLGILRMRSQLGVSREDDLFAITPPVPPDKGHPSNRLGLGLGVRKDDFFEELRIRAAYHGLMDNDEGYVEGAQLIFADLALRHYPEKHKLSLQELDIIDIFSLTPDDEFFHAVSWKVRTGLTRLVGEDDQEHLVYELNPGGGLAFRNDSLGLAYMMLETGFNVGGALEHDNAVGIGGSAGILKKLNEKWKVHAFVRDIYYGFGDTFNDGEAVIQQSFILDTCQTITVDVLRRKTRDFYQTEAKALWNFFF